MRREKVILIVTEMILAGMLVVDSFFRNIVSANFLTAAIGLLFLILLVYMRMEPENRRYLNDAIYTVVIIGAVYYMFLYLLGLVTGFYLNNNNLGFIVGNLFWTGCFIVAVEMFRYLVVSKGKDSKLILTLLVIVLSLCDVSDRIYECNFGDISDTVRLVGYYIVPSVIKNIALTYVALKVGYKPSIIYRFIFELPIFFLPIVPDVGEYLQTIFNIIVPCVLCAYFYSFNRKTKTQPVNTGGTTIKKTFQILFIVFIACFVASISGFFKYHLVVIGSGSMTPTIEKGDGVMVKKLSEYEIRHLKVGDTLVFKHSGIVLVHRITKVISSDNKYSFRTKGDFNNAEDSFVTSEKDVIGTVLFKVPKIGLPTVWVRELANF